MTRPESGPSSAERRTAVLALVRLARSIRGSSENRPDRMDLLMLISIRLMAASPVSAADEP